MAKETKRTAILEIGTEEIPARFITPALAQMKQNMESQLNTAGLSFQKCEVLGSPRRLTILLHGLPAKAEDRVDVAIGPPPKAAKDGNGNWTQAATGFAKAQKGSVNKLELQQTAKGERYVALHPVKGQKTEQTLKHVFPDVIQSLTFPKSMVWEASRFRFARPIRWIVALYNSKVIRFRLANVSSDKTTYGLLALGGGKIPVSKPERYKSILQNRCILVDPADREKKILSQLESLSKRVKAKPIIEPELLEEVVHITEYPTSILGHFPESYLSLPKEVLVRVLTKHQKFFPLQQSNKKLSNAFIGVRNGPSEAQDVVREGYERVLIARLADAKFFFDHDKEEPLENLANRLNEVGFHAKLGNLLEKTKRVQSLTKRIGKHLGFDDNELIHADRAAFLTKADLLTQIVGEFPELQGIAGRFYSLEQKEGATVAHAIEEHYWPLTTDGDLPKSTVSALVALADKLDTLAGNFYVGQIPSGSADPYGLRRSSAGVLRILLDQKWTLSLDELVEWAFDFDVYKEDLDKNKKTLRDFLRGRCLALFTNQGFRPDEAEAVLANSSQPLLDIYEKIKGLKAVRGRSEFSSLAAAIKRARNILRQAKGKGILPQNGSSVDGAHLTDPAEKKLYEAIQNVNPNFSEALKNRQYRDALLQLAPLKDPVDAFFEGVMVMVDDESVRSQRLCLLQSVETLFTSLADFSKLQGASDS